MTRLVAVLFQFPTNGKAHGNKPISSGRTLASVKVSIPYKRESTWELRIPIF